MTERGLGVLAEVSHEVIAAVIIGSTAVMAALIPRKVKKAVENGKIQTIEAVDARLQLVQAELDNAIRKHEEDMTEMERRVDILERAGGRRRS